MKREDALQKQGLGSDPDVEVWAAPSQNNSGLPSQKTLHHAKHDFRKSHTVNNNTSNELIPWPDTNERHLRLWFKVLGIKVAYLNAGNGSEEP